MTNLVKVCIDAVYLLVFLWMSYMDTYYTFVNDSLLFIGGALPILYIGLETGSMISSILLASSLAPISFQSNTRNRLLDYILYISLSILGLLVSRNTVSILLLIVPVIVVVLIEKDVMGIADLVLLSSLMYSIGMISSYKGFSINHKITVVIDSLIGFIAMTAIVFLMAGIVALSYSCEKNGRILFSDKLRIRGKDLLRAPWFIDISDSTTNIDYNTYKKRRREIAKKYRNKCIEVQKKVPLVPPLGFALLVLLFSI